MYPSIEQCKKRIKIIDLELESLMQSYGDISRNITNLEREKEIVSELIDLNCRVQMGGKTGVLKHE
jgi:hypothetical protein